ncbi:MAG: hypothetical protein IJQ50_05200, partial [Clostridia bacterium]|nr:hypothetical protein [Clostridia bacterium]
MEIPVYLFNGFLESGKTTFIQGTLEDERFDDDGATLLLVCEEGLEEYDSDRFKVKKVFIENIESEDNLNIDILEKFQKKHNI